jgi:ribosomal protein S18 acetylase RimI-like enzyme
LNIRTAKPEDVPQVLPMVAKIAALHERWEPAKYAYKGKPEQMYRRWLAGRALDPRAVFLVAERDALMPGVPFLVGFVVGTVEKELPIYRLAEYGFIHDLWVEPEYRNEGIGRQMTMLAIERFREIGVKQIRLDTAAANEPARKMFAQCGFRVSTMEMLKDMTSEE